MPSPNELAQALTAQSPAIDGAVVRDFTERMDPEYFQRFSMPEVAKHLSLVNRLHPDMPCQVAIETRNGLYEILVVAYDYFSELAGVCGLLAAFNLDIRQGELYTFHDASPSPPPRAPGRRRMPGRPGLARKKIVDLFHVCPDQGGDFTLSRQQALIEQLQQFVRLLEDQQFTDARRMVNRRLAETLGNTRARFSGLLNPIDIRFDNQMSPTDTVMDIRSADTPAFLYAFANALAMRGLYFHKAYIAQVGAEVHDRFWVRSRHGRKLENAEDQQELRVTATLIKQFTHFLAWAPDPVKAIEHFDLLLDRILDETHGHAGSKALAFLRKKNTLALLARVLGTSDFLWEDFLRRQHTNLLPILEDFHRTPLIRPRSELATELRRAVKRVKADADKRQALNQYKDQELFRIDMVHLMNPQTTLPAFSIALTELAEVILQQGIRDCQQLLEQSHGHPHLADDSHCPFALFGLGKFGGRELGYASDIEVLAVYGGGGHTNGPVSLENSEYFERLMQALLQRIEARQEGIFHLDVRLRPHGSKGLLANSREEFIRYYTTGGLAAPFERQALIKLRHVAGDDSLGHELEEHRDGFVYSSHPWDVAGACDLRQEQIRELVTPGEVNIKYSRGGLIDLEYAIQYLQLIHGNAEPRLRTTNTLMAIDALVQTHILRSQEGTDLRAAYLFLRQVIDALRIVRGHAKDLVLPAETSEEFIFLARRLGFDAENWKEGAARLSREIHESMAMTSAFFTRYFGPL